MNIISICDLSLTLQKKIILKAINLEIEKGQIIGLIGPSGSGKTTLMKTIIGFYDQESGKVIIDGKDLTKNKEEIRKIVGYSTQEGCFYEELTVDENLRYFGRLYDLDDKTIKERTENLLRLVQLQNTNKVLAEKLSGGMKRRLDLAIALIHSPKILILDELTTGLDPLLRIDIWNLIMHINKTGVTVIFSTHLLDEVEKSCNSLVMIKDGKIIACGSPKQLKNDYYDYEEIHLETYPANYQKIIRSLDVKLHGVLYYEIKDRTLILYTKKASLAIKNILTWIDYHNETLLEIEVKKPDIDKLFCAISKKNR